MLQEEAVYGRDAGEGDDDDDATSRRIPLGKKCSNTVKCQQMQRGKDVWYGRYLVWEEEERRRTVQGVCCVSLRASSYRWGPNFMINGQVYHNFGSLIPDRTRGYTPSFAQLYIIDITQSRRTPRPHTSTAQPFNRPQT